MARSMHRHVWLTRLLNMLVLAVMVMSFAGVSSILPALAEDTPAVEEEAPPVEEEVPPAEEPVEEAPPAEEPPAEEPVEEAPPAEEPPAEEPVEDGVAAGAPADAESAVETVETVAAEVVEAPVTMLTVAPSVEEAPSPPPPTTTHNVTAEVAEWTNAGECPSYTSFKIDENPQNKTYDISGVGSITISNDNGYSFDFAASGVIVHRVVVKASTWANYYGYGSSGVTGDTGLYSVRNDAGGYHSTSHVTFCYSVAPADSHIIVRKFHDENANGDRDGSEDWLADWEFKLERGESESGPWTHVETLKTTAPNGQADFGMEPMGWYRITEKVQSGWECTTENPWVFEHTAQQNSEKWFGNREVPDHTKTFELTYEGSEPANTTFWVKYKVDGQEVGPYQLTGSEPFSVEKDYPHGTVIKDVYWMAKWDPDGSGNPAPPIMIPLRVTETGDGEVIDQDKTNRATYGGQIKGHKYEDKDLDGRLDDNEDGLQGWVIVLERKVGSGWFEVGRKTTDSNGYYRFYSVLPGDYRVSEVQQDGWTKTKPTADYHYCTIADINVPTGELADVQCVGTTCVKDFMNGRIPDHTKTFELTYVGAEPANTTFWAKYMVKLPGGSFVETGPVQLRGPEPFSASVDYPEGTQIKDVQWAARWNPGGIDPQVILLRVTETGGETLMRDMTNRTFYDGKIKGHKYEDMNADGTKDDGDDGLSGWTIQLKRNVGGRWVPYAQTTTDGNGYYEFFSVLPGEYRASEVTVSPWTQSYPGDPWYHQTSIPQMNSVAGDLADVACVTRTLDFMNWEPASIEGYKFEDMNKNGEWDGNELALAGWVIYVDYDKDGVFDADEPFDTTDANGHYYIDGIDPGTWTVREVLPGTWTQSKGTFAQTFESGEHYIGEEGEYDFGNWIHPGCISGTKWHDRDADGTKDTGDEGLADWIIYVDYNDNGQKDGSEPSTVTAGDGSYKLCGIQPGMWKIREVGKADWTQSYPATGFNTVTVNPDEVAENIDFGNYTTGSFSGMKFHDKNADGTKDAGDDGLADWVIYADYDNDGQLDSDEPSATTDANGDYKVDGVKVGTWKVREVGNADWTQSYPADFHNVTITSQGNDTGNDFGNYTTGSFSGMKFHDKNADGTKDAGDDGLAGWVIYADYDNDGQLDSDEPSATTDANGDYKVDGVKVGTWKVREVGNADWFQSYPADYHDVTITSQGNDTGNDFGNYTYGGLMGHKYEDKDADGVKDPEDLGLEGWEITLEGTSTAGDEVSLTTTTDSSGEFRFEKVPPGTYTLSESLETSWTQSYPSGDGTHEVTVVSGQFDETDWYFMNWSPVDPSGYKFWDMDGNGSWEDQSEPGLEGWLITLSGTAGDGSSVVMTTTTDASGFWSFPVVPPGEYVIYETQQIGWMQTFPGDGSYETTLTSGQEPVDGFDFGNTSKVTKDFELTFNGDFPSDTTLTVSFDLDFEGGVPPVAQHESHELTLEASTTPGVFVASMDVWPQTVLSNVEWWAEYKGQDIYLGSGLAEELITEDVLNPFEYGGEIAAMKWNDLNGNGEEEQGEPTIQDWTMELYFRADQGQPWSLYATELTDAQGMAYFTGLLPGEYYVVEVQQDGWVQTAGSTGSDSSFPFPGEGEYDPFVFGNTELTELNGFKWDDTPERTPDFDLGAFVPAEGNGVWDTGEPALPDWEISLDGTTSADVPVHLTTTTDANGYYEFTNLMPGDYVVTETIPVTVEDELAWFQSFPGTSFAPAGHEVSLPAGEEGSPYNFGNFEEPGLFFEYDVGITKQVDDNTAEPGQILTYTLVYTNYGTALENQPVTIVDDFDNTYLSVHDANGGTVSGSTITWNLTETMAHLEAKTLTYQLKVADELPEGYTEMPNVVVIDTPDDKDPSNNSDDELVTAGEPFLPFTGSDLARLAAIALLALMMGVVLRRVAAVRTR